MKKLRMIVMAIALLIGIGSAVAFAPRERVTCAGEDVLWTTNDGETPIRIEDPQFDACDGTNSLHCLFKDQALMQPCDETVVDGPYNP